MVQNITKTFNNRSTQDIKEPKERHMHLRNIKLVELTTLSARLLSLLCIAYLLADKTCSDVLSV